MKFGLIFLCLTGMISLVESRGCGLSKIKTPPRHLLAVRPEDDRMLADQDWEGLRIHLDYSALEKGNFDSKDVSDVKKIMTKVKTVFEHLLKVKRINEKLKLPANNCEEVKIPQHYKDTGVDADLVIFVKIDHTGFFLQENIEAAAIHCLQDDENKRPVAGFITFKPQLKVEDNIALDYMTWLGVHEVTHVLAFNEGLYDDFLDEEGNARGADNVIGEANIGGKQIHVIKSPNTLEQARKHFSCSSLEGVPLEYNGGMGTAGAHWSKKYMNTDYMIGDSYGENLISSISLGILKDSGWYEVDMKQANLFNWGKKQGCDFFAKKCISTSENRIETPFKGDFCTKKNQGVCSSSNIFRGVCEITTHSMELPKTDQYFKNPFEGGSDTLTDFCPIPVEDKGKQNYYGGSCRIGESVGLKIETICADCACFENNLTAKNKFLKEKNMGTFASCFKFKCEGENLFLQVPTDEKREKFKSYACKTGNSIEIEGYDGKVQCPESKVICNPKYKNLFGDYEIAEDNN